ncbi:MAG: rod shape-determining protein RodA [Acidimicrobiales bacterium]
MTFTMDTKSKQLRDTLIRFDYSLALASVGIAIVGIIMVYSATRVSLRLQGLNPNYYLERQAIFVALGALVMVLVASIDYRKISMLAWVLYVGILLALIGVYVPHVGTTALGAQRWYQLGPFQLQPSEFATVAVILAIATYVDQVQAELTLKRTVLLLVLIGIPMILVVRQPDIGTGLIIGVTSVGMFAAARMPGRYLLALAVMAVVGMYLVVHLGVLKTFQVDRLIAFVHQSTNSTSANGYNLTESKIAIGAGGVWGKGLFHGTQTNLAYVPEQQTDFIFTAVAEQLGFVGAGALLAGFGFVAWRIWRAMRWAKDDLGRVIVAGVFTLVVYSVFQNAGMTMGIMPITGIPLPFLSYGGSAMLTFFAGIGLVLNVGMRRARS